MTQELQDDAPLEELAAKFVELFADKLHGQVPQKSACLKLYSLYNRVGLTWKKGKRPPTKATRCLPTHLGARGARQVR